MEEAHLNQIIIIHIIIVSSAQSKQLNELKQSHSMEGNQNMLISRDRVDAISGLVMRLTN